MSDVRDLVFGPCQTCLRPICQCPAKPTPPPDAQAMTREQVETTISRFLSWHECEAECDHDLKQVLATDAALRQALAQQAQEIDNLKATQGYNAKFSQVLAEQAQEVVKYAEEAQGYLVKIEHLADQIASLQARLTASEAKRKWTTARPTVKGQYWWRGSTDDKYPEVIPVFLVQGKSELHAQWGSYIALAEGGEWQGPLTPGEECTHD